MKVIVNHHHYSLLHEMLNASKKTAGELWVEFIADKAAQERMFARVVAGIVAADAKHETDVSIVERLFGRSILDGGVCACGNGTTTTMITTTTTAAATRAGC